MSALRHLVRRQPDIDDFLVGRLVLFAVVEARACERFGLLADALPDPALRAFYAELARAEARHHGLFLRLAQTYKPPAAVSAGLDAVLDAEAEIVATLPVRAALH
jgi:tRNA-(ms[2]io[6]A)-hydroxylase